MRKSAIAFALNFLRNTSVGSLRFVKDNKPIAMQLIAHLRPKTTKPILLRANAAHAKVKSPLDRFIEVNVNNINMLQSLR